MDTVAKPLNKMRNIYTRNPPCFLSSDLKNGKNLVIEFDNPNAEINAKISDILINNCINPNCSAEKNDGKRRIRLI
jgi:hypothetical protein